MTPAQAEAESYLASDGSELDGTGDGDRRTYRGRDLSEILPQIRAELGPDAVVTHQREGLVGGIGGFFAQRFIEIEAMAPPQRDGIDVYDGEDADPESAESEDLTAVDVEESEPVTRAPVADPFAVAPAASAEPESVTAARLDEGASARIQPEQTAAETAARPASFSEILEPALRESPPAEREQFAVPRTLEPDQADRDTPSGRGVGVGWPTGGERLVAPGADVSLVEEWASVPVGGGVARGVVEVGDVSVVEGSRGGVVECEVGELLVGRGLSAGLVEDLVGDARLHDLPFAGGGGMRGALRACLTRRLPRHRGFSGAGVLVAVVGGGGSGKTRCAAALAVSYRGGGALAVRAVVLGRCDSGAELGALVGPHGVSVEMAERGSRVADAIALARSGELVVADTPAVSPSDPAGITTLAIELAGLRPEEVLVTLPATSNVMSARQMLSALAPLSPSGIIVTHADETDQLGVAVELSLESGLPLVFIHDGLEMPGALAAADPSSIAERLLK
jgi:flagellar biosynthesis GTPase FlhF